MLQASQYITTIINSKTAITTALVGGLSWELSASGVEKPFMNFNLLELPGATKDSGANYNVTFFVFADTLTASATIGELLKTEIKNDASLKWKFISASNGYTSNEANEAYIEIQYLFTL